MLQISKSFDSITLQKIGKGSLIAMGGALATYLAANVDGIASAFSANPILASLVSAGVSILINVINQYLKGGVPSDNS